MTSRTICALFALASVTVVAAACVAPPESDSEETDSAAEAMTGFVVGPTSGIVKILVPGASGDRVRPPAPSSSWRQAHSWIGRRRSAGWGCALPRVRRGRRAGGWGRALPGAQWAISTVDFVYFSDRGRF